MVGKFLEVNVGFSIYPLDLISLCSKNTNPQHFHHHFHICASFLFVFFYQQMYFDDSQLVTPVAGVASNELCPKQLLWIWIAAIDTQHVFMCVDAGLIQYTVTDYISRFMLHAYEYM